MVGLHGAVYLHLGTFLIGDFRRDQYQLFNMITDILNLSANNETLLRASVQLLGYSSGIFEDVSDVFIN